MTARPAALTRLVRLLPANLGVAMLAACVSGPGAERETSTPTAADASEFLEQVNARMQDLGIALSRAGWVQQSLITRWMRRPSGITSLHFRSGSMPNWRDRPPDGDPAPVIRRCRL